MSGTDTGPMHPEKNSPETHLAGGDNDEVFVFPLSYAQQRLWVLDRLEPNSTVYNVPVGTRLLGKLNVSALQQSLTEILRRHEVLRATFAERDGAPIQMIAAAPTRMHIAFTDLSSLPAHKREAEARILFQKESQIPFDLSRGPVCRASLLKLEDADHVLLLNMHHIVYDGWSHGVLLRELIELYKAFSNGVPPALPELTIQYPDYAVWQRQYLSGQTLDKQIRYWKRQLTGAPASLDLPTDRPRPPRQTFRGCKQSIFMPSRLVDALKQLSRKEGVTLFMTLLAAFNVLLARYSGQQDIVVGTSMAGRNRREIENLIGFFVDTLPLRTSLSGNPSFRELLAQVRETTLGAFAHQDLPFEKLVEELKPARDLSRNPVFQVMFILQNAPKEKMELSGLTIVPLGATEGTTAKFDLLVSMTESSSGLRTTFEYNTDLFDANTVARMTQHFETLLQEIVTDTSRPVAKLPLLTQPECHQLLVQWNETRMSYPNSCIHELFEAHAKLTPDAVALVFEDQEMSYRELNRRANQLAHHLRKMGVIPETLVGICMERSLDMVTALMAVLKAGGAYVPLDPAYPRERLDFMLRDSASSVVLTNKRNTEVLPKNIPRVVLDWDWPEIATESVEDPSHNVTPDNPAYVIYTSGSTGHPKGVLGTHKGTVNRLSWMWRTYPFETDETSCQKTSLNFVDSVWEIFGPLLQGVKTVIIPDAMLRDVPSLIAFLSKKRVTRLVLVPSLLRMILDTCSGLQHLLPRLKYWVTSGEALTLELAQRFSASMPQAILLNLYGSTEVSADSTCYSLQKSESLSSIPIGRPIANTQIYILDRNLQPVPVRVPGELYVGGDGLARGYLNQPELTAERFIPNPFSQDLGARLYKTGDLARYLPDGNIQYLGRSDFQVKVRGFRVELGEIESTLTEHPAVEQAVAAMREESPGDRRLVAYVVLAPGKQSSGEELRSYLKRSLPDYMLPGSFVQMPAFPLTPSGKVDRRALPAQHENRENNGGTVLPRNDLEATLLKIWQRLPGLESIGVTDNFFEVGGHSLLAVRLMSEIQKATGKLVPLATLFQAATIQSLANVLRTETTAPEQMVIEIQRGGSKPPFFAFVAPGTNAVGYIALARRLRSDQPFYRIQSPGPRLRGRPYNATEFENLGADYIQTMKTVQPNGPYYFGGMCEGARIAFDGARLLEAHGEEVALLVIFDTWVLENTQIRALWKIDYYCGRLQDFWRLSLSEKWKTVRESWRRRVSQRGSSNAGSRSAWPAAYWPEKNFISPKYGGKITLFKRPKQPYFYVRDLLMGWGTRTTGEVELHFIDPAPHRHAHVFREPYVSELGEKLGKCLDHAQAERSRLTAYGRAL